MQDCSLTLVETVIIIIYIYMVVENMKTLGIAKKFEFYIYIYIYIYMYIYIISLLSLTSSHSLRPAIYLLLPYKIAFHYRPAWKFVFRIKQVTSGNFLYSYFICNMSIKESRKPGEYTHFKYSQMIAESISENCIIVYFVVWS